MARKHTLLFGVICVLLFILFVEARKDPQVSLTPIFPIGVANFGFWELRGSAVSQGDKIRLTRSDVNRVGSISSSANITKKTFFEASLKFSIFNTVLKGGEGIAFWLTSEQNYRLENNFGGPDTWKGIQVAFNTQGRYGADSSTVSLHTNDGTKKFIPQVIQTYKDTIVDSCNFNFRSESSPKPITAYILVEDNYFHLFLSADNGGTWNKCITKAEVDIPNEFYLSLTASTGSQFADIHDIHSLSVSSSETFDGEEEGFLRPPMTLIGHYITQNREKLIDQFLFGDDEDVEDEMVDLEVWFKSQLESLKLTIGGQVVELNIGLDEINQNSVKLQDRLAILNQANTNLVQNCNKLSADVEQYLHSEKVDTSYTPVNTLQNNLKSIETLSTSISNAVYSIQQNQNRRTSSKRRENKKVEKWLSDVATYLIFGLLIIAVIGILVFIVSKFTRRNSPRNAASPSWAF